MDFKLQENYKNGILNGDDLAFFYYDIGLDNLQGIPAVYDWDSIVEEFKGIFDISVCNANQIEADLVQNKIQFTVSNRKDSDNGSKSAAFFRHLRNAFAHYQIIRNGDNYILFDGAKKCTMIGLVNAEILKRFCMRFFDSREKILNNMENVNNPTL